MFTTYAGDGTLKDRDVVNDDADPGTTLSYLVLRCTDLERARRFYEAVGLSFVAEQHGGGAKHYASTLGGTVLELYPRGAAVSTGVRLGLRLGKPLPSAERLAGAGGVVERWTADDVVARDPDGHTVHLSAG